MTCVDCPTNEEILDREGFENEIRSMYPGWDKLSLGEQDARRQIGFSKTYVNGVLVD